jgi:spoIIIJ-associated protein
VTTDPNAPPDDPVDEPDEPAAPDPSFERRTQIDLDALGDKARDAAEFLAGLFERMDLQARIVMVREEDAIELDIEGPDAGRVIGKKGLTLDALQFLVNKVVNRFPEGRKHVVLDVEGYKGRRHDSLAAMAQRLADKASRTGKVISISPMPARERRVIHLALASNPGVTTRSEGEGSERRVRIVPQNRRRSGGKG